MLKLLKNEVLFAYCELIFGVRDEIVGYEKNYIILVRGYSAQTKELTRRRACVMLVGKIGIHRVSASKAT